MFYAARSVGEIAKEADQFSRRIKQTKERINPTPGYWYSYSILAMFNAIEPLLREFDVLATAGTVADIATADGDLAYFLESLGYAVEAFDYSGTRKNGLEPTRQIAAAIGSAVTLHDANIDSQFSLAGKHFDLAFFMGVLYHLKNPYYALEEISKHARYCISSTRICKYTPLGTYIEKEPVAYLLERGESNGDATNYWIFSKTGLKRMIERAGWNILGMVTYGDTEASNPRDNDHDERAYFLLESKSVHHQVPEHA